MLVCLLGRRAVFVSLFVWLWAWRESIRDSRKPIRCHVAGDSQSESRWWHRIQEQFEDLRPRVSFSPGMRRWVKGGEASLCLSCGYVRWWGRLFHTIIDHVPVVVGQKGDARIQNVPLGASVSSYRRTDGTIWSKLSSGVEYGWVVKLGQASSKSRLILL